MPLARALRRRGVAQLGSALALGARGRRFESCRPDQLSVPVAQRIERGTSNPGVAGSNPAGDTIFKPFHRKRLRVFYFAKKPHIFLGVTTSRHHESAERGLSDRNIGLHPSGTPSLPYSESSVRVDNFSPRVYTKSRLSTGHL